MEYSPKTAHEHNFNRDLIGIEYPGEVVNPERMIETLGGIREISTTFGQDKRRLELRFRPDCMYAKPALGDGTQTTGLALKVVVRRKKSDPTAKPTVRSVQIMGCVRRMYKFESLCDFQQLPAFRNQTSGNVECLHDEIVPKGVCTVSPFDKPTNIPFFLPPVNFSRADSINSLVFREPKSPRIMVPENYTVRRQRKKHGIYHPFSLTEPIPEVPLVQAQQMIELKLAPNDVDSVRAAFEKRPIWTKNALVSLNQLTVGSNLLGMILPTFAYYYVNGPWRGTWVRYGYDPRKHFEARVYQLLDFRVRAIGSLHECIKIKRLSVSKANYRMAESVSHVKEGKQTFVNSIFDEDTLPPHRVVYYQYCDIHVKKIQEMLNKVPSPKSGTVCDEKNGWLPYRFDDQCRNIMMEVLLQQIQRLRVENPDVRMEDDDEDGEDLSDFDEDEEGKDTDSEGINDSSEDGTD